MYLRGKVPRYQFIFIVKSCNSAQKTQPSQYMVKSDNGVGRQKPVVLEVVSDEHVIRGWWWWWGCSGGPVDSDYEWTGTVHVRIAPETGHPDLLPHTRTVVREWIGQKTLPNPDEVVIRGGGRVLVVQWIATSKLNPQVGGSYLAAETDHLDLNKNI